MTSWLWLFAFAFALGALTMLVLVVADHLRVQWLVERRERRAYIATLSPERAAELHGFMTVNPNWRLFRAIEAENVRREKADAAERERLAKVLEDGQRDCDAMGAGGRAAGWLTTSAAC